MAGLNVLSLWKLLSPTTQRLGSVLGTLYRERGTYKYDLRDLENKNLGSPSDVLFAFLELESREFGTVSGTTTDPEFIINRPRFESLFADNTSTFQIP